MRIGRLCQAPQIAQDLITGINGANGLLHSQHFFAVQDLPHRVQRVFRLTVAQDFDQHIQRRMSDGQADQEPV